MALKYPAPLNDNEWDSLMKQLNEKYDPIYIEMLNDAVENGNKIKEYI